MFVYSNVCVLGEKGKMGELDSQMMKMAAFQPPFGFVGWWMRELLLLLLLILPSAMAELNGKEKKILKRGLEKMVLGVEVWGGSMRRLVLI